eukprot:15434053-Alexandrium_andersonii.AAC.1
MQQVAAVTKSLGVEQTVNARAPNAVHREHFQQAADMLTRVAQAGTRRQHTTRLAETFVTNKCLWGAGVHRPPAEELHSLAAAVLRAVWGRRRPFRCAQM